MDIIKLPLNEQPPAPSSRSIRAASPSRASPPRPSTPDSQATISDSEAVLPPPSRPKRPPYSSSSSTPPPTDRRNGSRSTTAAVAVAVTRAKPNLGPAPPPLRTPPKGWFRAPVARANPAAPQKQRHGASHSAESSTGISISRSRGWTPINGDRHPALRTRFSVPPSPPPERNSKESRAERRSASERGWGRAGLFGSVFVEPLERAEVEFSGRGRGKTSALGSGGSSSTGRKRRRVGEMEEEGEGEGEGEEGVMKIGGQGKRRKVSGE
ncbi:hypothetical protein F4809DRAFT_32734 [Biscogniauxia mediterranea]|nr:hypothetical protein F4809DRAFT_32734 [Biscogniauxia mediterranea]